MEIGMFALSGILACLCLYLGWKWRCLRQDIYDFTEKLDSAVTDMLNEKELLPEDYEADDLWGRMYEKLKRLSYIHTHKKQEITEEKKKIKELVSDISHQTKTPIANIKLYLEMLEESGQPPRIGEETGQPLEAGAGEDKARKRSEAEILGKLGTQVEKLDFLLESMVKVSRLETGAIKIQKKQAPVSGTLAAAISGIMEKADRKNIGIHVEYDESLLLNHDPKWTAEALFNILDNGVKYTEKGGNIYIAVCRQEIFTKICVRDTGKGIALERQGMIFNRFYREPEIHDSEGIGIGLYLAREIIARQNGYIEVKSRPGQGSEFICCLPN